MNEEPFLARTPRRAPRWMGTSDGIVQDASHLKPTMKHRLKLFSMMVLLILCGSAETVSYIVNGKKLMSPYRCFLNQLVVLTCIVFFTSLRVLHWYEKKHDLKRVTSSGGQSDMYSIMEDSSVYEPRSFDMYDEQDSDCRDADDSRGEIDFGNSGQEVESSRAIQGSLFLLIFIMAVCDTISLYINLLASHNLSGAFRLILQQLSIPISMVLSFGILGRTFSYKHVIGSLSVVLGVVLCCINVLEGSEGQESSPLWSAMFAFSCIPLALGGCLKEWVLVQPMYECDAHRLNTLVSTFQFFLGLCLVPLGIAIQNLDMHEIDHISTGDIPANFWAGLKCGGFGINSYDASGAPLYGKIDCGEAVISTWLYIGTVCSFNLLMLWVIREGSAVLFFVASGASIPVVSLISASPLYKALHLQKDKYTFWQAIGLLMTVVGCIYFGNAMTHRPELEQNQTASEQVQDIYSEDLDEEDGQYRIHEGKD